MYGDLLEQQLEINIRILKKALIHASEEGHSHKLAPNGDSSTLIDPSATDRTGYP